MRHIPTPPRLRASNSREGLLARCVRQAGSAVLLAARMPAATAIMPSCIRVKKIPAQRSAILMQGSIGVHLTPSSNPPVTKCDRLSCD